MRVRLVTGYTRTEQYVRVRIELAASDQSKQARNVMQLRLQFLLAVVKTKFPG